MRSVVVERRTPVSPSSVRASRASRSRGRRRSRLSASPRSGAPRPRAFTGRRGRRAEGRATRRTCDRDARARQRRWRRPAAGPMTIHGSTARASHSRDAQSVGRAVDGGRSAARGVPTRGATAPRRGDEVAAATGRRAARTRRREGVAQDSRWAIRAAARRAPARGARRPVEARPRHAASARRARLETRSASSSSGDVARGHGASPSRSRRAGRGQGRDLGSASSAASRLEERRWTGAVAGP